MDMENQFEFEDVDQGIILKKYHGNDGNVAVPAQKDGKNVARIGKYAFAENRKIEYVFLPDEILVIDRHSFYNCRNLVKVSVPGGVKSVGDGAFKNCERLSVLELREAKPGNTCLKHLIYDQNHALKVMIHYQGILHGENTAYLYFPDFEYEYIANEPARIFSEVGYGAGYLYQQCFFDNDVDYGRYDSVFASAYVSEDMETLARIAAMRLRYPYCLSEDAEKKYQEYLLENLLQIGIMFLKKDERESLEILEKLGYFTEETVIALIHEAGRQQLMKGLAWLLNYKKKHFATGKQRFEL